MPNNNFGRRPKPNPIRKAKLERYEKALQEIVNYKFDPNRDMRMIAKEALEG